MRRTVVVNTQGSGQQRRFDAPPAAAKKYTQLNDALHSYIVKHSVRESPVMNRLRIETENTMKNHHQMISTDQANYLSMMVKVSRSKKAIEIGVFTGYSSLAIASALPDNGKLICCDIDKTSTDIARKYWKEANVDSKIELFLRPAVTTLDSLLASSSELSSFDFAFIDADKKNNSVYYEKIFPLMRPGGLIIIDNVLWYGTVGQDEDDDRKLPREVALRNSIEDFNTKLMNDDRIAISIIAIGDGLTLALKKE